MRSEPNLDNELEQVHAPRVSVPEPSPELEAELLRQWADRYEAKLDAERSSPSGSGPGPWARGLWAMFGAHRLVVALGLALLMVVGACALPTSYEVPLGISLEIRTSGEADLPAQEIANYVQSRSEAAEVDMVMREIVRDGGEVETQVQLRFWDQSLALGELEPELRERFPSLGSAEIIETALEGEVETIWARRLAHRAFHLSLREADLDEARDQLLAELQRQGFDAQEVVVKVRDREDGHREIEVKVERHHDGDLDELPPLHMMGPSFKWVRDADGADGGAVEVEDRGEHEPVFIHVRGEPSN